MAVVVIFLGDFRAFDFGPSHDCIRELQLEHLGQDVQGLGDVAENVGLVPL